MHGVQNYRKRAAECLAYARNASNDDERYQLMAMAQTLMRLALKFEERAEKMTRY